MAYNQHEDEQEGTVLPGNFSRTPAVLPNWRPPAHAITGYNEATAYKVLHHGPRMLQMLLRGMADNSNTSAELSAVDPYLAGYCAEGERRVFSEGMARIERYMREAY